MKNIVVEVCAGSIKDCIVAQDKGAHRIELNSGLFLGGLTPSLSTLIMAKENVSIPILPMLRVRGGGFLYSKLEIESMRRDAHLFAKHGADGLVFGFLNDDRTVDKKHTREFVEICRHYGIESIFHRAFDLSKNAFEACEDLIACGVDRILTSGQHPSSYEGRFILKELNKKYGTKIEFCIGSGVNQDNVIELIETTKIKQVHASFKHWQLDPTTQNEMMSYAYSSLGSYDEVSEDKLSSFMELCHDYFTGLI